MYHRRRLVLQIPARFGSVVTCGLFSNQSRGSRRRLERGYGVTDARTHAHIHPPHQKPQKTKQKKMTKQNKQTDLNESSRRASIDEAEWKADKKVYSETTESEKWDGSRRRSPASTCLRTGNDGEAAAASLPPVASRPSMRETSRRTAAGSCHVNNGSQ